MLRQPSEQSPMRCRVESGGASSAMSRKALPIDHKLPGMSSALATRKS
jgi:hypothetical protein